MSDYTIRRTTQINYPVSNTTQQMKITPEIITRYHLGQCSPEEKRVVELWLDTGIGEDIDLNTTLPAETEERSGKIIRQSLKKKLEESKDAELNAREALPLWKTASRYAAAVVVLTAFAGLYFFSQGKWPINAGDSAVVNRSFKTVTAPAGRKARFALPDGSQVQLNGGSTLAFAENFLEGTREVKLEGEAYFDVARREDLPFIIHTPSSRTEVLGTEFNLVEYTGAGKARLTVTEGKVRFSALKGTSQVAILTVGQQAIADTVGKVITSSADNSETLAWMHNTLAFDNEQFPEVARKIERWFGVKVTINREGLRTQRYTGSYENPDLKSLLNSLSHVLDFQYTIEKGNVKLH